MADERDALPSGLWNDITHAVLFGTPGALARVIAAPIHRDTLLKAMNLEVTPIRHASSLIEGAAEGDVYGYLLRGALDPPTKEEA